eukprot:TRINITY_DN27455_c0_g2_i1.p1 TRINITY_DN27455_c0_g2~~TRINITY_DN27455_c0_g2_i1.p1  ORF type:complete len:367 (+),score=36.17 TRINITY_DN27455_c0_g2_i1:56-1156(+)
MVPTFKFCVHGQEGSIPCIGLGTATLFGDEATEAVKAAIQIGYRHIDTALLYNNQEAVGEGIRQAIAAGYATREELFVTTKVAFYPAGATENNVWIPIIYHQENKKGKAAVPQAVDLCLKKLGLEYVDLLLIHNPCTDVAEYQASCAPHFFELAKSNLTAAERDMILSRRLQEVSASVAQSGGSGDVERSDTWLGLEEVRKAGKCRYIGVSNYPARLLHAMSEAVRDGLATLMPAVNQLELHPRYSSPRLRAEASRLGVQLTGYGSGNSVRIEQNAVVARLAAKYGCSPTAVVLRWTVQRGVVVVPRTANPSHIRENFQVATGTGEAGGFALSDDDLAEIDALNEDYPYYWSPLPCLTPEERQRGC